jgi:hypothetical protein
MISCGIFGVEAVGIVGPPRFRLLRRMGILLIGDPRPRFASSPTPPAGGGVYELGPAV